MAAKTLAYATGAAIVGPRQPRSDRAQCARRPPGSRSSPTPSAATSTWPISTECAEPGRAPAVSRGCRIEALADWRRSARAGHARARAWARLRRKIRDAVACRDARGRFRARLPRRPRPDRTGARRLGQRPARRPWLLEPRYLRRSAAEEQWDRETNRRTTAMNHAIFTVDQVQLTINGLRMNLMALSRSDPHQVGLRPAVEPVPDHPAGGRPRHLSQSDRALGPSDLDGKVVLDAGCGMGRYLRIAAESPAA